MSSCEAALCLYNSCIMGYSSDLNRLYLRIYSSPSTNPPQMEVTEFALMPIYPLPRSLDPQQLMVCISACMILADSKARINDSCIGLRSILQCISVSTLLCCKVFRHHHQQQASSSSNSNGKLVSLTSFHSLVLRCNNHSRHHTCRRTDRFF